MTKKSFPHDPAFNLEDYLTLDQLMEQGYTRMLNGREIILAPHKSAKHRIGFVYKDTGLPPSVEDFRLDNEGEG